MDVVEQAFATPQSYVVLPKAWRRKMVRARVEFTKRHVVENDECFFVIPVWEDRNRYTASVGQRVFRVRALEALFLARVEPQWMGCVEELLFPSDRKRRTARLCTLCKHSESNKAHCVFPGHAVVKDAAGTCFIGTWMRGVAKCKPSSVFPRRSAWLHDGEEQTLDQMIKTAATNAGRNAEVNNNQEIMDANRHSFMYLAQLLLPVRKVEGLTTRETTRLRGAMHNTLDALGALPTAQLMQRVPPRVDDAVLYNADELECMRKDVERRVGHLSEEQLVEIERAAFEEEMESAVPSAEKMPEGIVQFFDTSCERIADEADEEPMPPASADPDELGLEDLATRFPYGPRENMHMLRRRVQEDAVQKASPPRLVRFVETERQQNAQRVARDIRAGQTVGTDARTRGAVQYLYDTDRDAFEEAAEHDPGIRDLLLREELPSRSRPLRLQWNR